MKVAVITPFYEGENYLDAYLSCMKANAKNVGELLVIMVNDSPWIDLKKLLSERFADADKDLDKGYFTCGGLKAIAVDNESNCGIHKSRVNGLNRAKDEGATHVIFLDQDDILSDDAVSEFIKSYENNNQPNVVISNARLCQKDWTDIWVRTDYHANLMWDLHTYISIGTQILSPGQCLIDVNAIPDFWCENIIDTNGSDDYYLWLLMLGTNSSGVYIDKPLYTHSYTEKNISSDTTVTDDSTYSFIPLLEKSGALSKHDCDKLLRMIEYKAGFRKSGVVGKMLLSLRHFDLFWDNLVFKKKTGTRLGFNR